MCLLVFIFDLTVIINSGVLVLLVLRDKIVHVALSFGEFHLIHTFTGVPVEEGLAAEHGGELLGDALEHFLDAGVVTDEGDGHLESLGRNVADGSLDVIRDPLDEVGGVLVLDVEHLLVDFFGGHATTEEGGGGEVAAVARVGGAHHVLGVEHLLGELRDGEGAVLLRATGGERSEAHHEEVETGERNQVDGELAEIGVELTGEAEAAGDAGHDDGDEMVQVTEGRGGELESTETDVIQRFIIDAHGLIGVLDQLMDGEGRVVRLDDGVGDLRGRNDGEGHHDAVRVFLAELGDEESSHTGAGTTTEGVRDLETLEAIAGLGFLAADVEDGVDELSTFSVVTLGPVVASTGLSEDEVVRAEDLAVGTSANGVHGAGLQVHEDGAGNVASTSGFVEVDVDAFELEIGVSLVGSGGINSVFVADDLPEFGADLVAALTALDTDDFTHVFCVC
mgnify:CR=1 FL=1